MFDLKPIKRNECMYKRSKYDILLDEFEKMNVEGVEYKPEGKAYSVAAGIRKAIKRNHRDHIECFSKADTVYLFNTILEGREK